MKDKTGVSVFSKSAFTNSLFAEFETKLSKLVFDLRNFSKLTSGLMLTLGGKS